MRALQKLADSHPEPSKRLADTDPVHALHNTGGQAKTGLMASRISPPVVPCYEWRIFG
jgi:hypothetical protein